MAVLACGMVAAFMTIGQSAEGGSETPRVGVVNVPAVSERYLRTSDLEAQFEERRGKLSQQRDAMQERIDRKPVHVIVMHANVTEEAEALKKQIETEFKCDEIYISDFSPTMGVQAGPGVLGVAFYTEDDSHVE